MSDFHSRHCALLAGTLAFAVLLGMAGRGNCADATAANSAPNAAKLRHPVALAAADKGQLMLTANERSGSVSIVDLNSGTVAAEVRVGQSLSDLIGVPRNGENFLATDQEAHQLVLLSFRGNELRIFKSLPVSAFPVSVSSNLDGTRCFVASLWSRKLTVVALSNNVDGKVELTEVATLPLPFAPRRQILSPDGMTLVVADAFGGKLATIDLAKNEVAAIHDLPAHNIRGLAWSTDGKQLLLSHQTLRRTARTTKEDIHWGSLVANVVRFVNRDALLKQGSDLLAGSGVMPVGDVGDGGGDPAALAVADGHIIVALAGVGEIAIAKETAWGFRRVTVGTRPMALLADPKSNEVYVANTFDDSITVLVGSSTKTISLGPQPELTAAERGERLFFDASLSHDKWMSCHSCHTDGQSTDLSSDTLGDGSYGSPKRIPALSGVGETGPWGWSGSFQELSEQVRQSAETTMRGKSITESQVQDLTEYLKTLPAIFAAESSPSESELAAIERGRGVLEREKCNRCHVPPTYTSAGAYEVGIKDEMGNSRFNPPSLRGVGQRTAFFHDGRADSLEKVFSDHRHQIGSDLSASDLANLVQFLRSL
jgi:DNA-binding beta-propeller fold protein YncE